MILPVVLGILLYLCAKSNLNTQHYGEYPNPYLEIPQSTAAG